ncbi:hypothetical protein BpJC7_07380 [Weizmannia acidilactici]|uniref:Uncharacterized protein n=1 Tax=Weizmannia acidilactici TaxID=2607726 RepID=A0A5J4JFS0_9BACI|nr:hypothetical protein [Weizmannia acidilactici]GER66419.1 hypothetical protein BpJC4_08900 [Weizmannia acidilactici]GER69435.1 hypothetical protein BpJC7_07380 [Weizmannia acidilactici]GER72236.1 hypothetical protein BpPP18_03030 [Weizmannia acidilactici]
MEAKTNVLNFVSVALIVLEAIFKLKWIIYLYFAFIAVFLVLELRAKPPKDTLVRVLLNILVLTIIMVVVGFTEI